jgi:hypothetical protein
VSVLQISNDAPDPNWYKPGPKMLDFHSSRVRVRVLVGGRGTGKTTGVAVEVLGHALWNAGAKIYILRKTQDSNEDTTQETFEQVFRQSGTAYIDTGDSLFKKIDGGKCYRLPSKKAVELFNEFKRANPRATKSQTLQWLDSVGNKFCSFVYFAGVPSSQYRASRFRGYECSMLIFVEADQLEKEDLDLGVACLRWKGADPQSCDEKGFIRDTCVILDTNPPSPRHWIAKLEEKATKENDANVKFWHIATRENRHNLPEFYVERLEKQYEDNPAMYQRMLLGEYAEAFEGSPVLFAFKEPRHARESLPFPQGAYLIRGWDFGTTHSVIWSAYWAETWKDKDGKEHGDEYWWDLYEFYATQSDVERQCRAVREITETVFPFWNDRAQCTGVLDYCDIAGTQKKDTGSSLQVLRTYGFYPGYARVGLQESIAIYNRLLERKDRNGDYVYKIDKEHCKMLYVASLGGYRYPMEGEPGFGSNEPLKGDAGGNYDHLADASRYAKMGALRIIKTEYENSRPLSGKLAQKTAANRPRRYF